MSEIFTGYALPLAVAGTIGTATVAYRVTKAWVVKPAMKFVRDINVAIETIHEIAPGVREMASAFGENGGKNLRADIQRTSGRVNLLIDQSHVPTWEADSDGNNSRVNPSFEHLFGYSAADIRGHGWKNLLHEDDAEGYFAAWEAAVKDNRMFQRDARFKTRDNLLLNVNVQAASCPVGHGLWMGTVQVLPTTGICLSNPRKKCPQNPPCERHKGCEPDA